MKRTQPHPERKPSRQPMSGPSFNPTRQYAPGRDNFRRPPLPPRDHRDHHQAPNHRPCLTSNAFKLELKQPARTIYEYRLTVNTASESKGVPDKVFTRNFVSKSVRKLLSDKIFPQLIPNYSSDNTVIEFILSTVFSTKPLILTNETEQKRIAGRSQEQRVFKNLIIESDFVSRLHVDISISFNRSFKFDSITRDQLLTDSLLNHRLLIGMFKFGSNYFNPNDRSLFNESRSRLDLISDHVSGIALSNSYSTENGDTIVVISSPNSYMTGSFKLIDLLNKFMQSNHIRADIRQIQLSESWFLSFLEIISGYRCRADGPMSCVNLPFVTTSSPASSLEVYSHKNLRNISVLEQYETYGSRIRYPNLPCIEGTSNEHPYYPIEFCSLQPGQKVPIFRLAPSAHDHLDKLNKPRPDTSFRLSMNAKQKIDHETRGCFENFGLKLSDEPIKTYGYSVPKPTLKYRGLDVKPARDSWESGAFVNPVHLVGNWCVVNTTVIDSHNVDSFFREFSEFCLRFGMNIGRPSKLDVPKQDLTNDLSNFGSLVSRCRSLINQNLRLIMFVIDSTSTQLNRNIHLHFNDDKSISAACIRAESIENMRLRRPIFRSLIHKLNTRLGGTNLTYHDGTMMQLNVNLRNLMIIGLDVTHPDNELKGVSIVGCAYTCGSDLFRHRAISWPQKARMEIINKIDRLIEYILRDYHSINEKLPEHIVIYRDGVSHEEFGRVRLSEITKVESAVTLISKDIGKTRPKLSYVVAQKRHTMRFYQIEDQSRLISNAPSGTLIDKDVVAQGGNEFYLFSSTSPHATARPLHYHVLKADLSVDIIKRLTYVLCFNSGKCSNTLSMPSSLKYAHNAAYDARNRVIASKEFKESKFYPSKFF